MCTSESKNLKNSTAFSVWKCLIFFYILAYIAKFYKNRFVYARVYNSVLNKMFCVYQNVTHVVWSFGAFSSTIYAIQGFKYWEWSFRGTAQKLLRLFFIEWIRKKSTSNYYVFLFLFAMYAHLQLNYYNILINIIFSGCIFSNNNRVLALWCIFGFVFVYG